MAAKYAIIEAMDKYEKIAQELGVSLKTNRYRIES